MTERLFDKEAIVRVQAIHAMARLQSLPVDDSSDFTILDIFIDLLQHDPSADVRKAALLQVDVTPKSLPFILERLRDVDSVIRRLFFSKKMAEIDVLSLSIQQRDEILRAGLMDREAPVRQACSDMIFEHWIQKTDGNLIQFLAGLDVLSNTEIAEVALKNFFEKLPDMLTDSFTSQFLESMTVEMAFVLRVYCEHQLGLTNGDAQGIQDALPELSVMAQYVRGKYDAIVTCSDDLMRTELEFVLNELLKVCFHLDYSDEVGRRSIFEALQEIMSNLEIGTGVFETCIKIFAKHSSTISEFLSSMTEFVGGFRDVYESPATGRGIEGGLDALKIEGSTEEEPPEDGISDEIRIMANLKALEIIRNILCNPEIVGEFEVCFRFPYGVLFRLLLASSRFWWPIWMRL
jgi:condensin complex subunit 3